MSDTRPESAHEPDRGRVIEGIATATRPVRKLIRISVFQAQRILHPLRHRRAVRSVQARRPVSGVLFICLGNICRSPYAEFRLRKRLEGAGMETPPRIASAGFILPGRPSPETALSTASSRGLDMHEHRSQTISPGMFADFDLVIAMTRPQVDDLRRHHGCADAVHLGDLDPSPVRGRDIEDPYGGENEQFEQVYERIDRALEVLEGLFMESSEERTHTVDSSPN